MNVHSMMPNAFSKSKKKTSQDLEIIPLGLSVNEFVKDFGKLNITVIGGSRRIFAMIFLGCMSSGNHSNRM